MVSYYLNYKYFKKGIMGQELQFYMSQGEIMKVTNTDELLVKIAEIREAQRIFVIMLE